MSLLKPTDPPADPPKLYRPYYVSNLLAGLQAIDLIAPGVLDTGDWYMEVLYELQAVLNRAKTTDSWGPNVSAEGMSLMLKVGVFRNLPPEVLKKAILEAFSPLELLALVGKDEGEQDNTG